MGTVDLNDLDVFAQVVETASFTAAATRLGLPKSSVSRAVTRLEAAMGVPLLHRTTRKVAPSTAGKALYDKVGAQVVSLRQSVAELPELEQEPSGCVRITAAPATEVLLADIAAHFIARYPAVEVEMRLTTEYVDLVAEGIDLGLRFATRPLADSSLTARKLCPSTMRLYASPSYVTRHGVPREPRDLDDHHWVVYQPATKFRLEGGGRPVVITTTGRIASDDMAFHRAAIIKGCGIGYLAPWFAEADAAAGNLVPVLPKWHIHVSNLWALWPGRRLARKTAAFLDMVSEAVRTRTI